MRVVSWNVLADLYMLSGKHGNYSYVKPSLRTPSARLPYILGVIDKLQAMGARLIALQEADTNLLGALRQKGRWQLSWSPDAGSSIGCLMLTEPGILVEPCYNWPDQRAQMVVIGKVGIVNTHIQWAPADEPNHPGVRQTQEILSRLGDMPAIILTDSNDRPGGPVRALLAKDGFSNTNVETPTAYVNTKPASLDLVAARGVDAKLIDAGYRASAIPNYNCPSDHVPVMADLSW